MRIVSRLSIAIAMIVGASTQAAAPVREHRRLPLREYRDKMKAGWIGQMVGVGWGGPTEFRFKGQIIPEDKMPRWKPELVNQFQQDDIYVEMTFVRTLEQHGLDVPIRQAGIDWANSGYRLWHANRAGRTNLRKGIAPPDSGHPQFNKHADDIDYQIEADFSGLVAPGLPNRVIALGETFGRLMNYGDGLYGGQFVGGMYAEAFFETDPVKIVEAGLRCIPEGSQYAETVRDVLRWYKDAPDDWQKAWRLIEEKYQRNPAYRRFSCDRGAFNIDAKINGAYIVMGLLYGKGDFDKTIVISTRCGQDSDCNPSNAGGVLFSAVGASRLPPRFTSALNEQSVFSHTAYSFPRLIEACEKIARKAVVQAGGRIERDSSGQEVFVIPVLAPKPGKLEQCWEPGPAAGSRFTDAERARITAADGVDLSAAIGKLAPGWKVIKCGSDMAPGLRDEWRGKKNVLLTHPLNQSTGCVVWRQASIPAGRKTSLRLVVGHHPQGNWTLIVKANGKPLLERSIGRDTARDGWLEATVDLTPYAGKSVKLELVNQPSGWTWEAAYWARIAMESQ